MKTFIFRAAAVAAFCLAGIYPAYSQQTTLTSQPDSSNGNDAYVYNMPADPNTSQTNYGTSKELDAFAWTAQGNPAYGRGFINFNDLQLIPQNKVITSATLYLYGLPSSGVIVQGMSGDNAATIQRVTGSWDHSSINWANQPTVTAVNEATIPASTSTWGYNAAIDVKNLVQDMVNLPVNSRYGFCLKLNDENPYNSLLFGSSRNNDSTLRPKLVVTYSNVATSVADPKTADNNSSDAFPINISPNPAKAYINIDYVLPSNGPVTINIVSVATGKLLKTMQISGTTGKHMENISLSGIGVAGIVTVQVTQGDLSVNKKVTILK